MKPFEELTRLGRARRMRRVAGPALEAYGLGSATYDLISNAGNTLYRVRSDQAMAKSDCRELFEPGQLLLRIHWPGYREVSAIRVELEWLRALRQERDLPVPEPVPTPDGELLVEVSMPGVPETRHCSLLRWLKGRRIGDRAVSRHYEAQGRLMAEMHNVSESWRTSDGAKLREYDYDGLFREIPSLNLPLDDIWSLLPESHLGPYKVVAQQTREAMERLGTGADAYGLIHADLAVDANLLFWGGNPRPIDFDEMGLGYWVYDLAVALEHCREQGDYSRYRDVLLGAYSELRTLPEEQAQYLDLFTAALDVYFGLWANALSHLHPEPEYDEARQRSRRSLRLVEAYLKGQS